MIEIYRFYVNLRMNLIPYIYNKAEHTARSGEPLMRPLAYQYPADSDDLGNEIRIRKSADNLQIKGSGPLTEIYLISSKED